MNVKFFVATVFAVAMTLFACSKADTVPSGAGQGVTGVKVGPTSKKTNPDGTAGDDDDADPADDPCQGIGSNGTCASGVASVCVQPAGGKRTLSTTTCKSFETCSTVGKAHCEPAAGKCSPGAERCTGSDAMELCGNDGNWSAEKVCGACSTASGQGVTCPGALADSAATTVTASIAYQLRGVNSAQTDWSTHTSNVPAQEALMMSFIDDPNQPGSQLALDATLTDANGNFTLKVPTNPGVTDVVVAFAMHTSPDGPVFAIARPDFPDGTSGAEDPVPDTQASAVWSKTWPTSKITNSVHLTISEAEGSGAFRMFDIVRWARERTELAGGPNKMRLLVLMRPNTDYDCGTCFLAEPISFAGSNYDAQIRFGVPAGDDAYWADAVMAHEFGHSIMSAYGTMPDEGGEHVLSCLDAPGMAWSEGWATGFSSLVRGSPVYWDKQQGTFFWFDISQHVYSDGSTWDEPTATGGLFQNMDENGVSSILWNLADHSNDDTSDALSNTPAIMQAMESKRLNEAHFARGYTAQIANGVCQQMTLESTNESAPMVADFLDAVVCNKLFPNATVENAIGSYPYNVNRPLCN